MEVQPITSKTMYTVFYNAEGAVLTDYMSHEVTAAETHYADLPQRLRDLIYEKLRNTECY